MTAAQGATFEARLRVQLRRCRRDDLRGLEWFGMFSEHRALIAEAFTRQERGEVLMLVAESARFPVGQLWLDLARDADRSAGLLWALRVLSGLQGAGIGSRLLAHGEGELYARGFAWAEIGVELDNPRALRLYERLGYARDRREQERVRFAAPDGSPREMLVDQWIMRKRLTPESIRRRRGRATSRPAVHAGAAATRRREEHEWDEP